jgi:hypothetical protein
VVELLERGINCLGKERGSCGGRMGDRQEVGSERTRLVRGGLSAVFMGARGLAGSFASSLARTGPGRRSVGNRV